ncbi:MAG: type VI secretion system baseplate subunit TssK [Gemmatimonas sp.]|nr:type VI secretion system baseplate subunit TssK [Gemmatimonas sp.]
MTQLQKVLWTKGILLSPQHLQAQDRYLTSLIDFQLTGFAFAPWGFHRLELDHEALADGTVSVTSAAGLFHDSLPFEIPSADVQPSPKPIEEHWGPDRRSMAVYLGVPEHRVGGHNVSLNGSGGHTRYLAEAVLRRDENTGLMEKPLQMARRNLRLLLEGEVTEGHSVLQIARVIRAESGQFQLDPGYVPPLLDIAADGHLMSIARRLVEILSARSSALSGTRRHRNRGLADFGSSDSANFWLLYTINTHFPVIRHLYEVRRGHPEILYRALLGLAGALTTLSPTIRPRDLPAYDHSDIGGCFGHLDAQLRDLLETVVPVNHITLPLRPTGPLVQATALDDDRLFDAAEFYLGVRAEMPGERLTRRAPDLLKVSAADQVDWLIRQAVAGVGLRHVPTPPNSLPVKLDYHYFQLGRSGPRWDEIKTARNLAVYVPSDFPDPQLELVVLLPDRKG